jgi:3-hydroxybutyryl-CoA dehydrogenase
MWAKEGHQVTVYRPDAAAEPDQAIQEKIRQNLHSLVSDNVLSKNQVSSILHRIRFTTELASAADATFIVEAGPESIDLKRNIFGELDRVAPCDAILSTTSSSLTLADVGVNVAYQSRLVGVHFYAPAYLIPLVEITRTPHTEDWVVAKAIALMIGCGKVPVQCKDSSGYIAARLQATLGYEAIRLLEEGIATPEDIDKAVRYSFAPRLTVYGPLEMADRGGLDVWATSGDHFYQAFGKPWHEPPDLLKEKVARGELGVKSGKGLYPDSARLLALQHDRQLIRLLQYLGQVPKAESQES